MARQRWSVPIGPFSTADGAALANSVALTDISATPQITFPANLLEKDSRIEIDACGQFSTTGTPTLLLGLYLGGVAGVALAASTAITTGSGAAAWPFILRYRGTVRTDGSTGSIVGQGELLLGTSLIVLSPRAIPETAAARTVTIDTTAQKIVTVGAQWGTASASNTITCNELFVKLAN